MKCEKRSPALVPAEVSISMEPEADETLNSDMITSRPVGSAMVRPIRAVSVSKASPFPSQSESMLVAEGDEVNQ